MDGEIAIGVLSRETGCNIETIRYYERIGLLPQPARRAGGYRRYGAEDIARLRFVRRARQLGFALDEIRALLALAGSEGDGVREQARAIGVANLAKVRAKIADLEKIEHVLSDLIRDCEAGLDPKCPLIEALAQPTAAA